MNTRILALTASAAIFLAPAFAQDTPASPSAGNSAPQQVQSAPATQAPAPVANANDTTQAPAAANSNDTTQARQPLQLEQHEGFWGKINPFARKKYVRRQLQPVVNRVNELDQLTAANSNAIRDVDSRAQEGIRLASAKANEADQHAVAAGQQAQQAGQTAQQASTRLTTVQQAVSSLDQYQPVTDVEIHFRPGQTVLTKKAKDALDQLADQMKNQHGTIIQVQGFSSGARQSAISNSQAMAEAVVRYMVLSHDIPVYRFYTVGMGNAPISVEGKTKRIHGGRVDVSLLKNSAAELQAAMGNSNGAEAAAPATSQGTTGAAAQSAPANAPVEAPPSANTNAQPAPANQPAPAAQPVPATQPQAPENPR